MPGTYVRPIHSHNESTNASNRSVTTTAKYNKIGINSSSTIPSTTISGPKSAYSTTSTLPFGSLPLQVYTVDSKEIAMLGIAVVIAGHNSFWNIGLQCGYWEFFLCTIFLAIGYVMAVLCLAEMTSTLPFAGGMYGFVRLTCGSYVGYIIGCIEVLQNVSFTASLMFTMSIMFCQALEGFPSSISLLFTAMFFYWGYWITVQGGQTFWYSLSFLVTISTSLLVIYLLGSSSFANMDDNDTRDLMEPNDSISWQNRVKMTLSVMPYASWFFVGIKMIPIAASEVNDSKKSIPRGMIFALGVMILLALALITTVSAQSPGAIDSSHLSSPLANGYMAMFGLSYGQASALSIPSFAVTSLALMYIYGRQIRAMAQSRLFLLSSLLSRSFGLNQTPRAGTVFGSIVAFILIIGAYAGDKEVLTCLNNIAMMLSLFVYLIIFVSFIRFRDRFDRLPADFRNPLGLASAYIGIFIFSFSLICMVVFQPPGYIVLSICVGFVLLISILYKIRIATQQGYSDDERKTLFAGYVINFNRIQRQNVFNGGGAQGQSIKKGNRASTIALKKKVTPMSSTSTTSCSDSASTIDKSALTSATVSSKSNTSSSPSKNAFFAMSNKKSLSSTSLVSSSSERNLSSRFMFKEAPNFAATPLALVQRFVSNLFSTDSSSQRRNQERIRRGFGGNERSVSVSMTSSQATVSMQSAGSMTSYYQGCIIEDDEDNSPLPPSADEQDIENGQRRRDIDAVGRTRITNVPIVQSNPTGDMTGSTRRYDSVHLPLNAPSSEFSASVQTSGGLVMGGRVQDSSAVNDARSPERSFRRVAAISTNVASPPSPVSLASPSSPTSAGNAVSSFRQGLRNLRISTSQHVENDEMIDLERNLLSPSTPHSCSSNSTSWKVGGGGKAGGGRSHGSSFNGSSRISNAAAAAVAAVTSRGNSKDSFSGVVPSGTSSRGRSPTHAFSLRNRSGSGDEAGGGSSGKVIMLLHQHHNQSMDDVDGESKDEKIVSGHVSPTAAMIAATSSTDGYDVLLPCHSNEELLRIDEESVIGEKKNQCTQPQVSIAASLSRGRASLLDFDDEHETQSANDSMSSAPPASVPLHSNSDVPTSTTVSAFLPTVAAVTPAASGNAKLSAAATTSSSLLQASLNSLYRVLPHSLLPSSLSTNASTASLASQRQENSIRNGSVRRSNRLANGNNESSYRSARSARSIRSIRSARYEVPGAIASSSVANGAIVQSHTVVDHSNDVTMIKGDSEKQRILDEERSLIVVNDFHASSSSSFPQMLNDQDDDLHTAYLDQDPVGRSRSISSADEMV